MSLRPVALQTSSASSTPQRDWATQNFVPPPLTEKSNWIHEVSLRSFGATAISASWFSPSSVLSVSGAVINAPTSRIRHSSYVVNPPCLRVPNLLSRIPTVKQIEPLLSAIRAVIHKPSPCQSTDTCPNHQFLVSTPKFSRPDLCVTPAVVTKFKRCTVTDVVATALRQGVVCLSNVHSARRTVGVRGVGTKSRLYTQTNQFFRKGLFCTHLEIGHRYEHEHVTQTTLRQRQRFKKHKKSNQNLNNATRQ